MRVLVACEESQSVCTAFRAKGHEAYSCDLKPCSGGHPEWHIRDDAIAVLNGGGWDLCVAHPPCTYLSKAGATSLFHDGDVDDERYRLLTDARAFFMAFWRSGVPRLCIENPTPLKAAALPAPSQTIQPHMFGHPFTKKTLLWLRNLPPLMATELVVPTHSWTEVHRSASMRSKTFPGIAAAMAEQWGVY